MQVNHRGQLCPVEGRAEGLRQIDLFPGGAPVFSVKDVQGVALAGQEPVTGLQPGDVPALVVYVDGYETGRCYLVDGLLRKAARLVEGGHLFRCTRDDDHQQLIVFKEATRVGFFHADGE